MKLLPACSVTAANVSVSSASTSRSTSSKCRGYSIARRLSSSCSTTAASLYIGTSTVYTGRSGAGTARASSSATRRTAGRDNERCVSTIRCVTVTEYVAMHMATNTVKVHVGENPTATSTTAAATTNVQRCPRDRNVRAENSGAHVAMSSRACCMRSAWSVSSTIKSVMSLRLVAQDPDQPIVRARRGVERLHNLRAEAVDRAALVDPRMSKRDRLDALVGVRHEDVGHVERDRVGDDPLEVAITRDHVLVRVRRVQQDHEAAVEGVER